MQTIGVGACALAAAAIPSVNDKPKSSSTIRRTDLTLKGALRGAEWSAKLDMDVSPE